MGSKKLFAAVLAAIIALAALGQQAPARTALASSSVFEGRFPSIPAEQVKKDADVVKAFLAARNAAKTGRPEVMPASEPPVVALEVLVSPTSVSDVEAFWVPVGNVGGATVTTKVTHPTNTTTGSSVNQGTMTLTPIWVSVELGFSHEIGRDPYRDGPTMYEVTVEVPGQPTLDAKARLESGDNMTQGPISSVLGMSPDGSATYVRGSFGAVNVVLVNGLPSSFTPLPSAANSVSAIGYVDSSGGEYGNQSMVRITFCSGPSAGALVCGTTFTQRPSQQ